jgi:hypothetical protein
MPEAEVIQTNRGAQPTAVQQERIDALKRSNWLFIYAPILFFVIVLLVLTGLLLWGAFSPNIVGTREFASGVADVIIILTTLPMILLCLTLPLGLFGFTIYRRQKQGTERPYGRLRPLFWRVDNILDTVQDKVETTAPKVAQPVTKLNALVAFIGTWLEAIVRYFRL